MGRGEQGDAPLGGQAPGGLAATCGRLVLQGRSSSQAPAELRTKFRHLGVSPHSLFKENSCIGGPVCVLIKAHAFLFLTEPWFSIDLG